MDGLGTSKQFKTVYNNTRSLQARLEEQCTELKGVVREHQDVESEHAAL
jgi:hypothetical protein